MSLHELSDAVREQRISDGANVLVENQEPWMSARQALELCPELKLTKSHLAALLVATPPLALLFVHVVVFGAGGILWLLGLALVGLSAALVLLVSPSLRVRTTGELLTKRALVGVGGLLVVAEAAAGIQGWDIRRTSGVVDVALASEQPCDVEKLSSDELEWMNSHDTWQRPSGISESRTSMYESRRQACRKDRDQQIRRTSCDKVANDVQQRGPISTLPGLLDREVALAQRMVGASLTGDDLKAFSSATLPCGDGPNLETFRKAFVAAAAQAGPAWLDADSVSSELMSAVRARGLDVGAAARIRSVNESMAGAALAKSKTSSDLGSVVRQCRVEADLGAGNGPNCRTAADRYEVLLTREDAARKAKDAQEQAMQNRKDAQCEARRKAQEQCVERCERRLPADELGFADFDQAMNCQEKCDRAVPLTACE